jgi:hypothetical protein
MCHELLLSVGHSGYRVRRLLDGEVRRVEPIKVAKKYLQRVPYRTAAVRRGKNYQNY